MGLVLGYGLEKAVCFDFMVGLFWNNKWMIVHFVLNLYVFSL
jgi:hypothetical protein